MNDGALCDYPITREIIEDFVVELVHTASKPDKHIAGDGHINYMILKMLPTTVEKVKAATKLTKVPVYKHLGELEKYGLIKFWKGTGQIYPTDMTKAFFELKESMELHVRENVLSYLSNMVAD